MNILKLPTTNSEANQQPISQISVAFSQEPEHAKASLSELYATVLAGLQSTQMFVLLRSTTKLHKMC